MALNRGEDLEGLDAVYGTAVKTELSPSELEAARLGFTQMLRRKRFSARFIEANAEDLLARARFEYTRAVSRGAEIHTPAGWLINCAWRRTQNLLEAQRCEPTFVSTEKAGVIEDEATPTPELAAIEGDRARRIGAAVAQLSLDQRTLIELSYFEGMSVREAGRFLGWHSSKAQRCHESALRRLREILGIEDVDALAIEIGLAAWVSLASGRTIGVSVPAGVEAALESGGRAAGGIWSRAQELVRRVVLGGASEPSSAMAAGGAARTAGVCGAAAVACFAGGVIGPGIGGVGLLANDHHGAETVERRVQAPSRFGAGEGSRLTSADIRATGGGKFAASAPAKDAQHTAGELSVESSAPAPTPTGRTEKEFSPFGGDGAEPSAAPGSARQAPGKAGAASEGGSASTGAASADQEFGAFK